MAKFKHLTKEKLNHVRNRLFEVSSGLNGLGSLFESQSVHFCPSPDELYGIGQLLKQLSREVEVQEDILNCGYDSQAVKKNLGETPVLDSKKS